MKWFSLVFSYVLSKTGPQRWVPKIVVNTEVPLDKTTIV
ncbi:hypothetical protein RA11412_1151 [Rothia aeria]|uniref:Uncharacterized protein n=2 Tax=Rothia aeria TaxID=172042 RepID=A0A2Z5QYR2_9MICC|nr:hypothetical protein HMPREF1324_0517 [Rothia aeria F0474]BAV87450.1 hypothetical protein RA11412_1151 [Rothia aeria]